MSANSQRVRKLVDATGPVPHSEAWFDFYLQNLNRLLDGEDIGNIRVPIEVIDRLVELADREDQKAAWCLL